MTQFPRPKTGTGPQQVDAPTFAAFREVPRTGVIYVTTEAQRRGYATAPNDWGPPLVVLMPMFFIASLVSRAFSIWMSDDLDENGVIPMDRIGCLRLPSPLDAVIDVWWLRQYAGGLLLPLRDGTAGQSSYGGGRYALDSAKGADLGGRDGSLVIDLNFLYHPSCRYDDAWQCPLAPPGNTIAAPVTAGERL